MNREPKYKIGEVIKYFVPSSDGGAMHWSTIKGIIQKGDMIYYKVEQELLVKELGSYGNFLTNETNPSIY